MTTVLNLEDYEREHLHDYIYMKELEDQEYHYWEVKRSKKNSGMAEEKSPGSKEEYCGAATITHSLFSISLQGAKVALEKNVDINLLYMLYRIDLEGLSLYEHPKLQAWIQSLIRKGLLTKEGNVTLSGQQLLVDVANQRASAPVKIDKADDPFEKWWKDAHPTTDFFEYKGRVFPGAQSKKKEKEKCRQYYWEIINEGIYTHADIFNATILNVENAKELSLVSGRSELHFISNSEKYLRLRQFVPFVEAARKRSAENKCKPIHNQFDFDI